MSYHFCFLSPRFNLAFLASDTRITIHQGKNRSVTDGIRKIQQISDFAWLSWTGFQPLAESYAQWLRKCWQVEFRSAKGPDEFLRDEEFHARSRAFCHAELDRLKNEYRRGGVPSINELIHMVLVGMTAADEPFFIAINHGGPDSFAHTFVSMNSGEFPHVYPLEEKDVMDWVKQGLGVIQKTQANVGDKTEFIKRTQNVSAQVFKEISALTTIVSSSCDCVVITAETSALRRCESKQFLKVGN